MMDAPAQTSVGTTCGALVCCWDVSLNLLLSKELAKSENIEKNVLAEVVYILYQWKSAKIFLHLLTYDDIL